jgi:excisionase family DNA binding protein
LPRSQLSRIHELNGPSGNQSRQTVDLFLDAIADAIADRLEYRQSTRQRVLNSEKAAEYLGISENQIYNLVSDGRLTPVRFDRRIRFDVRDLDALIEETKGRRSMP